MVKQCTDETWEAPVSVELGFTVVLTVLLVILQVVFGHALWNRYHQLSQNESNKRKHQQRTFAITNAKGTVDRLYCGGFRKEEMMDIGYVIFYFAVLFIQFMLSILHFIPSFEDSMVSKRNNHKHNDDDYHLQTLFHYCVFERTFIVNIGLLFGWVLYRIIFSRLFTVFRRSSHLRFSTRMEWFTMHILIDLVPFSLLCGLLSTVPISVCIGHWKPKDWTRNDTMKGNREYFFNCSVDLSLTALVIATLARVYFFILTLLCIVLFLRKFRQMADMLERRHSTAAAAVSMDATNSNVNRNINEEQRMMQVMVKLTTLSLFAMVTSWILSAMFFILLFLSQPVEWTAHLDYLTNLLCLVLLFRWMDQYYQLFCVQTLPCVHRWVESQIRDDMSIVSRLSNQSSSNVGGTSN